MFEDKKNLMQLDRTGDGWLKWLMTSFDKSDLWITLNIPDIEDPKKWLHSKITAIENRVYLKSNSLSELKKKSFYRFAVIVNEPQKHIHLIMRNVKYKPTKHRCFREFVEDMFLKSLSRPSEFNRREKSKLVVIKRLVLIKKLDRYIRFINKLIMLLMMQHSNYLQRITGSYS